MQAADQSTAGPAPPVWSSSMSQSPRSVRSASRRRNLSEAAIGGFLLLSGLVAVAALAGILVFFIKESVPALRELGLSDTVFGTRWNPTSPTPGYGMLPMIVSTLMVTGGALVITVPWGIAVAAYIGEIASPWVKEILKPLVETLAIFPSAVLGFIALELVAPAVARVCGMTSGQVALTGAITLAVMVLPTIVSVSEDAINAVSRDYREASYALGATRWQTIRHLVLPYALPGMATGSILGLARAAGETAPIILTGAAYFLPRLPSSVLDQFMALPYHLYILATQHANTTAVRPLAYGTALVLLALVMTLNLLVMMIRARVRRKKSW